MFPSLRLVYCFVDIAVDHFYLYRFTAIIEKHTNASHLKVHAEKTYRNADQAHENWKDK